MTLSVPGPAEALLREHCELQVLGEILAPERYREAIRGADALLPQLRDRIDEAALDAAGPHLQVVSNYAVGLDNIDIPDVYKRQPTMRSASITSIFPPAPSGASMSATPPRC